MDADGLWIAAGVIAAGAAGAVCLGARRLGCPLPRRGVPVLRYHLVGPPLPGSVLNDRRLPMSAFGSQLRHLARRGFRAVTLSEALERRADPAFLRAAPVVLTFDGPSASLAHAVWPALERHGLARATLFFPPGRLGARELRFPEGGRPEPLLTPAELRRLAGQGLEVGLQGLAEPGHTRAELTARLREGRERLGAALGAPVRLAAHALGHDDPLFRSAAARAGFVGVATHEPAALGRRTSPFRIPRQPIGPGVDPVDFALALARRSPG